MRIASETGGGHGRIEELQVVQSSPDGFWRRIAALFPGVQSAPSEIYRQVNRYDAGNRIVQIERQSTSASATADNALQTRTERYAYDEMDRLSTITDNNGIATTFQYDKGGNRIAEATGPSRRDQGRASTHDVDLIERTFHYAAGSNRLMAVAQTSAANLAKKSASFPTDTLLKGTPGAEQIMRSALHTIGVPRDHDVQPVSRPETRRGHGRRRSHYSALYLLVRQAGGQDRDGA